MSKLAHVTRSRPGVVLYSIMQAGYVLDPSLYHNLKLIAQFVQKLLRGVPKLGN